MDRINLVVKNVFGGTILLVIASIQHNRLAYISELMVNKMLSKCGINASFVKKRVCVRLVLQPSHIDFPYVSKHVIVIAPFDLLYMNICGSLSKLGINGECYFLQMIVHVSIGFIS